MLPAAETNYVRSMGLSLSRAFCVNADSTLDFGDGLLLSVLPSAHEEIELDENGNHRFLGFVFTFGDTKIYHSGDSILTPAFSMRFAESPKFPEVQIQSILDRRRNARRF